MSHLNPLSLSDVTFQINGPRRFTDRSHRTASGIGPRRRGHVPSRIEPFARRDSLSSNMFLRNDVLTVEPENVCFSGENKCEYKGFFFYRFNSYVFDRHADRIVRLSTNA